jgi:hypothetical protein
MASPDRQKIYQARWREKQGKIKRLAKLLDDEMNAMEHLPHCAACSARAVTLPSGAISFPACSHSPMRKRLTASMELTRLHLEQLEH